MWEDPEGEDNISFVSSEHWNGLAASSQKQKKRGRRRLHNKEVHDLYFLSNIV
jgi:hypothetical protein